MFMQDQGNTSRFIANMATAAVIPVMAAVMKDNCHHHCNLDHCELLENTCRAGDFLRCYLADLDFSPSHLARAVLDFYKTHKLDLCRIQGTAVMLFPKKTFPAGSPIFFQVCRLWKNSSAPTINVNFQ